MNLTHQNLGCYYYKEKIAQYKIVKWDKVVKVKTYKCGYCGKALRDERYIKSRI